MLTVDLTQYKGDTIRIHFYAAGDGFFPATMWVDDVSITQTPTLYVAKTTPWRLLAKDDRAGVDYSQHRVDGGGWSTGTQFTLSSQSDGTHTVEYRSMDNSGNVETAHSIDPYLDDVPPNTAANLGDSFLAGSVDKVLWGAFEHPAGIYGWVKSGDTSASTTIYHSGSQSALIAGGTSSGAIYQDIAISGSATNAVLSLWYRPILTGQMFNAGMQSIMLKNTSGTLLEILYQGWNWDPGYFKHIVADLTRFRGQTVRLEFAVASSISGATSGMYVDDVALLEDPAVYVDSTTQIYFFARDLKSGVQYTEYQIDTGGWLTTTPFTFSAGDHTLSYRSVDNVNVVEPTTDLPVKVDSSDPDGTILIAGGATETGTRDVPLMLTATPSVTQMRFKNEVGDWSSWVAYADTYSWTLTAGAATKTVYAEFRDASLNVSPQRYDTIIHSIPSSSTIPEAKKLARGTTLTLPNKVGGASFSPSGRFYIQELDRAGGIGVIWTGTVLPGDVVEVVGTVDEIDGECVLLASTVVPAGPPQPPPIPILVKNADVGGADFAYQENPPAGQKGVLGGTGLNNVGLLLTTSGWVSAGGATWIYVDDGSTDSGLKVDCTYLTAMPPPGIFIVITGVCGVEPAGQDLIPVLRPRSNADISTTYPEP